MSHRNYREQSRDVQWGTTNDGAGLSIEQINCGSLLRIADASEKMAQRYTELIDKASRLEKANNSLYAQNRQQERSMSALKGQITKLKRKLVQP